MPIHWKKISSWNEKLAKISLKRSGEVLLTMEFYMAEVKKWRDFYEKEAEVKNWLGFYNLISGYSRRIKDLYLSGLTTNDDFIKEFVNYALLLPSLERLELKYWQGLGYKEDNPFQSFLPGLKYLDLEYIPLYPSFRPLNKLTHFKFKDPGFNYHIDILFEFLEQNALLETVDLDIDISDPGFRSTPSSRGPIKKLKNLSHLRVVSKKTALLQTLISKIRPPDRGSLEIISQSITSLGEILSDTHVKSFMAKLSPDCMELASGSGIRAQMSGQNGSFYFHGPPSLLTTLDVFPSSCYEKVRELRLETIPILKLDPQLFPALEVLSMFGNESDMSHILSGLFSSPKLLPKLKTISIDATVDSENFRKKLVKFIKERKKLEGIPLPCVEIVGKARGKNDPIHTKLRELRKHMDVVHKDRYYRPVL